MASRKHGTLTASSVETVEVDAKADGSIPWTDQNGNAQTRTINNRVGSVEVVNVSGDDAIYFTVDGTDPAVQGDDTYVLPTAAGSALIVSVRQEDSVTVKLISEGTPVFSVSAK